MKKLLSILATVGLVATTGATVVACGPKDPASNKADFTINLKDTEIKIGKTSTITIDKYDELKENLENFDLVFPTDEDQKDIIKVVDFNDEEGAFTIEALKLGSIDVQVKAVEKVNSEAEETIKKLAIQSQLKWLPMMLKISTII